MSTTTVSFPITLTVTDSNGNTVGTTQITQEIADELYTYYVQKLESDSSFYQWLTGQLENDSNFVDALYSQIKEKLLNDYEVLYKLKCEPPCPQVPASAPPALGDAFNTLTKLMTQMIPIISLSALMSALTPRSTATDLLDSILPLIIVIPLINKLA